MSSSANVLSNIFNLTKKNILITGGSSGLGEHFAYLMASAGAPLRSYWPGGTTKRKVLWIR